MSKSSMEHIFRKMIRAGETVNKKGEQVKRILADTGNEIPDLDIEATLNAYLITLDKAIAHLQIAIQSFVEEKEKYRTADKKEMEEASKRMAEAVEIMASGEETQSSGVERIEIWKFKKSNQQMVKKEAVNTLEEGVSNTEHPENLQKIKIPHFDGNINKFKNFWAIFENSFHNTKLSNMTKFTYLHYYLKGPAADLIQRYDVTGENYEAAVALLKKRYDNQTEVIDEMNEELKQLQAVSDQTTDQQKMFDKIFVLVDQLQRRGETMDVRLVKSMIIDKFSEKIRDKIFKSRAIDAEKGEHWTLTKLLAEIEKILERERKLARVHELSRKKSTPTVASSQPTKPKQYGFTPVCKFCEIEGHHVFNCEKYDTPQARRALLKTKKRTCWNCLANSHDTNECQSKRSCKHCNSRHHSSLCLTDRKETQSTKYQNEKRGRSMMEKERISQQNGTTTTSIKHFNHSSTQSQKETKDSNLKEIEMPSPGKLITLRIKAYNQKLREWQDVSVFLDNGSSNSYVTRSLAENWGLEKIGFTRFGMQTFSHDIEEKSMDVAKITLQEASGAVRSLNLMVTEKMTGKLAKAKLTEKDIQYIVKMKFTINPEAYDSHSEPDITIGMDYYNDIQNGTVDLPSGIKLIKTIYGCTTMGRPSEIQKPEYDSMSFNNSIVPEENDFQMEFEMLGQEEFTGTLKDEKRIENEKVHENFKRTIEKRGDRYFVRLPTKPGARESLPDNYGIALRRLESISKQCNPDVLKEIDKIFKKQEEDGIIERVQSGDDSKRWIHYNPHQPVVTPQKTTTKVRVVIDGSSHLKNKPSLNDMLYQGPVILPEISHLFLRFRSGKTAVISDVEKAFLQVFINEEDRDATRVLWLKDFTKPATKNNIVIFRFNRVIFGLNCSPFLLAGTILHHLEQTNSTLTNEIKNNMYVDNLAMTTDKTKVADLQQSYIKSKEVFREMGMNLREFLTNNVELMQSIPEADRASTQEMKFLGIQWDALQDKLKLKCEVKSSQDKWTKRTVSSVIGAIYDPQGYFAPLLLPLKKFLASAWDQEIGWDETIPDEWINEWDTMIQKINGYSKEIPRKIFTKSGNNTIVTFSDASQYAYAACSYAVNSYGSNLAFTKTRLKPSKVKWTIPKLELAGICLGMEVTKTVLVAMKTGGIKVDKAYLLTDSEIVIGWLKAQPGKKETGVYITNRLNSIRTMVAELEQTGTGIEFGYINTKINPADVASRGGSQEEMSELWWHGPDFINEEDYEKWPQSTKLFKLTDVTGETLSHTNFAQQYEKDPNNTVFDCRKTNSYSKMVRTAAYVNRFIRRSMRKLTKSSKSRIYEKLPELKMEEPLTKTPNSLEWKNAEKSLIRDQQKTLQIKQLKKLQNLNVKLDKDGLLRCHGRLENAELATNQKQPFLISEKSALATLLVRYHHEHWHGSTSQTVGFVRRKFWIPKLRQLVKKIRARCTPCQKIHKAAYRYPDMANLPETRVRKSRPFQHCGLDYFGPIFVRQKDGSKSKVFGCIITCLSTRLTFLDVAQDLSTASFLNVLRRFFSLRGVPDTIVSDNGPQFILADEMIQQTEKKTEDIKEIYENFTAERGIKWKFNTAFSPWKGGVFERLIRITKEALHKSIGKRVITEEDLRTSLYEIADSMNKRPLTYAEDDVDEIRPIRPIDFLQKNFEIYDPIAAIANQGKEQEDEYQSPEDLVKLKTIRETRRSLQSSYAMTEKFWKIYTEKYLNQLRETHKLRMDNKRGTNESPTLGKVVLICDDRYPRNIWKMGRITKIIKNSNQVVREIEVTYMTNPENDGWKKRTIRRPPNLVVPLELEDEEENQEQLEITQDPMLSDFPNVEGRYSLRKRREVNYGMDDNVTNSNFSYNLGVRKHNTHPNVTQDNRMFNVSTVICPLSHVQLSIVTKKLCYARNECPACKNKKSIYIIPATNQTMAQIEDPIFEEIEVDEDGKIERQKILRNTFQEMKKIREEVENYKNTTEGSINMWLKEREKAERRREYGESDPWRDFPNMNATRYEISKIIRNSQDLLIKFERNYEKIEMATKIQILSVEDRERIEERDQIGHNHVKTIIYDIIKDLLRLNDEINIEAENQEKERLANELKKDKDIALLSRQISRSHEGIQRRFDYMNERIDKMEEKRNEEIKDKKALETLLAETLENFHGTAKQQLNTIQTIIDKLEEVKEKLSDTTKEQREEPTSSRKERKTWEKDSSASESGHTSESTESFNYDYRNNREKSKRRRSPTPPYKYRKPNDEQDRRPIRKLVRDPRHYGETWDRSRSYYDRCVYCQFQHYSDECPIVTDPTKRREILKKQRRCTACCGMIRDNAPHKCRQHPCRYCKQLDNKEYYDHHSSICSRARNEHTK